MINACRLTAVSQPVKLSRDTLMSSFMKRQFKWNKESSSDWTSICPVTAVRNLNERMNLRVHTEVCLSH